MNRHWLSQNLPFIAQVGFYTATCSVITVKAASADIVFVSQIAGIHLYLPVFGEAILSHRIPQGVAWDGVVIPPLNK